MKNVLIVLIVLMLASVVQMAYGQHTHKSEYAGQETRLIKSLSEDDIAELKRGGGWGLAKAAELNGVPGPLHLLEVKEEINLDRGQVLAITKLYEQMKAQAIEQGEQLIELEQKLETHFRNRTITEQILGSSLDEIATTRKKLRYIHLAAHLKTPEMLSQIQINQYNELRGYSTANSPCANVPKGHDEHMWRKHHGCEQ